MPATVVVEEDDESRDGRKEGSNSPAQGVDLRRWRIRHVEAIHREADEREKQACLPALDRLLAFSLPGDKPCVGVFPEAWGRLIPEILVHGSFR